MTTLSKEDVVRWEAEADKFKTGEFTDTLDLKSFATLARANLVAENERLKTELEKSDAYTERKDVERDKLRAALAAAEAREGKLRAAIDVVLSDAEECEDHDGWLANLVSCEAIHQLDEAFSQPRDDSALREMIAGVYEEVLTVIQPDDSYQDDWFKAKVDCCNRVRALAEKVKGRG